MLAKVFVCLLGVQLAVGASVPEVVSFRAADHADQSDEAIRAYWTPERMAKAVEFKYQPTPEQLANFRPAYQADQETVSVQGALPEGVHVADIDKAVKWPARDVTAKTVAKIFFSLANGTAVTASGVVINSNSKVLVYTAAHVLHAGKSGGFNRNFLVVPNYKANDRPLGSFTFANAFVLTVWTTTSDLQYNFGAIITRPLNGKRIVDAAGAQGIVFNSPNNGFAYQLGYPTGSPFDGEELYYCTGPTFLAGANIIGQKCNLRLGASGGPWLVSFNTGTGLGQLASVYSHSLASEPDNGYGAYFSTAASQFYDIVAPRTE